MTNGANLVAKVTMRAIDHGKLLRERVTCVTISGKFYLLPATEYFGQIAEIHAPQ